MRIHKDKLKNQSGAATVILAYILTQEKKLQMFLKHGSFENMMQHARATFLNYDNLLIFLYNMKAWGNNNKKKISKSLLTKYDDKILIYIFRCNYLTCKPSWMKVSNIEKNQQNNIPK